MLLVSCIESRRMKVCLPTCAAGITWFGCGWRGVGDGAPHDGLEFLDASTGVAYLRERIIDALGPSSVIMVPVSVGPPPPPSFPVKPYVSQYPPS